MAFPWTKRPPTSVETKDIRRKARIEAAVRRQNEFIAKTNSGGELTPKEEEALNEATQFLASQPISEVGAAMNTVAQNEDIERELLAMAAVPAVVQDTISSAGSKLGTGEASINAPLAEETTPPPITTPPSSGGTPNILQRMLEKMRGGTTPSAAQGPSPSMAPLNRPERNQNRGEQPKRGVDNTGGLFGDLAAKAGMGKGNQIRDLFGEILPSKIERKVREDLGGLSPTGNVYSNLEGSNARRLKDSQGVSPTELINEREFELGPSDVIPEPMSLSAKSTILKPPGKKTALEPMTAVPALTALRPDQQGPGGPKGPGGASSSSPGFPIPLPVRIVGPIPLWVRMDSGTGTSGSPGAAGTAAGGGEEEAGKAPSNSKGRMDWNKILSGMMGGTGKGMNTAVSSLMNEPMLMASPEVAIAKLVMEKIKERLQAMGDMFKEAGKAFGGETVGKAGAGATGSVEQFGKAFGNPVIEYLGKFGKAIFEGTDEFRNFTKSMHEGNIKFAEFSSAMARVQVDQEVRELLHSQVRGERRAASAEQLAKGRQRLEEALSPWEDRLAIERNKILGRVSENIADILEWANKRWPFKGDEPLDFEPGGPLANIFEEAAKKNIAFGRPPRMR